MTENHVEAPRDVMCTRCIMRPVDDPDLVLTDGVCHHCRRYDELISTRVVPGEAGRRSWTGSSAGSSPSPGGTTTA